MHVYIHTHNSYTEGRREGRERERGRDSEGVIFWRYLGGVVNSIRG